jgi:microcystin-dependent protein
MKKLIGLILFLLLSLFQPKLFAADVTPVHTVIAVAATSTAVSARATRRMLVIQNVSDASISCKFGAAAVVTEGIVLNPQGAAGQAGGSLFFDVAVPVGALNCIHGGSGTKNVLLTEGG